MARSSPRWLKIGGLVTFCTSVNRFNTVYRVYGPEHHTGPISNVAISKWSQFLFLYFVGDLKTLKNSSIEKWRSSMFRKFKHSVRLYGSAVEIFHSRLLKIFENLRDSTVGLFSS